jgi:hypothetical protein
MKAGRDAQTSVVSIVIATPGLWDPAGSDPAAIGSNDSWIAVSA